MAYCLAFLRTSGILLFMPIFSSRGVPWGLRMTLAGFMALMVGPFVPRSLSLEGSIPLLVASEFLTGMVLGLGVKVVFGAIETAGQLMGYQMGFGMGEILDPQGEYSVPVFSSLMTLFAIMAFLSLDLHHWWIASLVRSFDLIPPGGARFQGALSEVLRMGTALFGLALRLAAPLLVLNLLFYTALSILARAVPQMNVFLVSLPLQVGIGLLGLGISLPYMASFLGRLSSELRGGLFRLLELMGG